MVVEGIATQDRWNTRPRVINSEAAEDHAIQNWIAIERI